MVCFSTKSVFSSRTRSTPQTSEMQDVKIERKKSLSNYCVAYFGVRGRALNSRLDKAKASAGAVR